MNIKDVISQVRHLDIITNRNVSEVFAGNYKSSFKGQGLEIDDLREYTEGDDVRHIDWIITAKQGKPFIKKYKETRELTTMLLIDVSSSMNFTSTGKYKKDIVIESAAILLFSALKNGDKFGLILFSDQVEKFIPPGKGKVHLLRILREIIIGFDNNQKKSADLKKALIFFNGIYKKQAVCFLFSDDVDEQAETMLRVAGKKHDLVFASIMDPFEKGIIPEAVLRFADLEKFGQVLVDFSNQKIRQKFIDLRKIKYEKKRTILRKNKIDYLELLTDANIYKELLIFFKKRQLKY